MFFLETKRLILKIPTFADYNDLLALRTDPEVMKFGTVQTKEQVKKLIENADSYFAQYNLAFFSVFKKETNEFVGQAGLFHLGYDTHQPEIELAYRLLKKFWHKGYATELAKFLIAWGFKHLAVDKLVAVIHTNNEKSRHVIQKAGMRYSGITNCYNSLLAKYEIHKNNFDFNKVSLVSASLEQYPIIQNMAPFYVYDMSEYFANEEGWGISDQGSYICMDFKKYWLTDEAFPYLIYYKNELAGFVIIDKKGSNKTTDYNMAQFFILRKFKHKGLGRFVAYQCFDKYKGNWEVMVLPGNEGAYRFWRSIICGYTANNFTEETAQVKHFNNKIWNIFHFRSIFTKATPPNNCFVPNNK